MERYTTEFGILKQLVTKIEQESKNIVLPVVSEQGNLSESHNKTQSRSECSEMKQPDLNTSENGSSVQKKKLTDASTQKSDYGLSKSCFCDETFVIQIDEDDHEKERRENMMMYKDHTNQVNNVNCVDQFNEQKENEEERKKDKIQKDHGDVNEEETWKRFTMNNNEVIESLGNVGAPENCFDNCNIRNNAETDENNVEAGEREDDDRMISPEMNNGNKAETEENNVDDDDDDITPEMEFVLSCTSLEKFTSETKGRTKLENFFGGLDYCPFGFDEDNLNLSERNIFVYSGAIQSGKSSLATLHARCLYFQNNKKILFENSLDQTINALFNIIKYSPTRCANIIHFLGVSGNYVTDSIRLRHGHIHETIYNLDDLLNSEVMKVVFHEEKLSVDGKPLVIVIRGMFPNFTIIDSVPLMARGRKKAWLHFRPNDFREQQTDLLHFFPKETLLSVREQGGFFDVVPGLTNASSMDLWYAGLWLRKPELKNLYFVVTTPLQNLLQGKLGNGFPGLLYFRNIDSLGIAPGIMKNVFVGITMIDQVLNLESVSQERWSLLLADCEYVQFPKNRNRRSTISQDVGSKNSGCQKPVENDDRLHPLGRFRFAGVFFSCAFSSQELNKTDWDYSFGNLEEKARLSTLKDAFRQYEDYLEKEKLFLNFVNRKLRSTMVQFYDNKDVRDTGDYSIETDGRNDTNHAEEINNFMTKKAVAISRIQAQGYMNNFFPSRFRFNNLSGPSYYERKKDTAIWYGKISCELKHQCWAMCHDEQLELKQYLELSVNNASASNESTQSKRPKMVSPINVNNRSRQSYGYKSRSKRKADCGSSNNQTTKLPKVIDLTSDEQQTTNTLVEKTVDRFLASIDINAFFSELRSKIIQDISTSIVEKMRNET